MSYTEVIEQVQSWPLDERQKLVRHLEALEAINDPAYLAALTHSIDELRSGRHVTREQLLAHLEERGIRLP